MARLISIKNKKGILWNLPTVLGDWYVYVVKPGELRVGQLKAMLRTQYLVSKQHQNCVLYIKAWCRLDSNMNAELVQPEEFVIVDEFLREV